jgi:hypothetical protein
MPTQSVSSRLVDFAPTSEHLYLGMMYIGFKRYFRILIPIIKEQCRDKSPAGLYVIASFRVIARESSALVRFFQHKHLVKTEEEDMRFKKLIYACEYAWNRLDSAMAPYLRQLQAEARREKAQPWMEAFIGDEDSAVFLEKFHDTLTEVIDTINSVKESLAYFENEYHGLAALGWNQQWNPGVPWPKL